jgi:hypothetical protein
MKLDAMNQIVEFRAQVGEASLAVELSGKTKLGTPKPRSGDGMQPGRKPSVVVDRMIESRRQRQKKQVPRL